MGNAESNGFEFDFAAMITDNWSITGAASFLDSTLTSDYRRNPSSPEPDAASGTDLPRVPDVKFNLTTRYDFMQDWFVQASYMYTGKSTNTLFDGGSAQNELREQPSYDVLNTALGLQRDTWTAEVYVQNVTDERGVVWINAVNWDTREQVNQPRSIGVRWRQSF